jgi:hypothetical protein
MAIVNIDGPVQPKEKWRFGPGFTRRLPAGVTIASVSEVKVYRTDTGADVTDAILVTGSERVDPGARSASAEYQNFEDGVTYKASFLVLLTNGEKREGDLLIPCSDY